MAVFWAVALSSLVEFTSVSEVLASSIIRVMSDECDGVSKDL
jgi:hypothetical protein